MYPQCRELTRKLDKNGSFARVAPIDIDSFDAAVLWQSVI